VNSKRKNEPQEPVKYRLFLDGYDEIEMESKMDIKGKWWEAMKCHYRTFEVCDILGSSYAIATNRVIMVEVPEDINLGNK